MGKQRHIHLASLACVSPYFPIGFVEDPLDVAEFTAEFAPGVQVFSDMEAVVHAHLECTRIYKPSCFVVTRTWRQFCETTEGCITRLLLQRN